MTVSWKIIGYKVLLREILEISLENMVYIMKKLWLPSKYWLNHLKILTNSSENISYTIIRNFGCILFSFFSIVRVNRALVTKIGLEPKLERILKVWIVWIVLNIKFEYEHLSPIHSTPLPQIGRHSLKYLILQSLEVDYMLYILHDLCHTNLI